MQRQHFRRVTEMLKMRSHCWLKRAKGWWWPEVVSNAPGGGRSRALTAPHTHVHHDLLRVNRLSIMCQIIFLRVHLILKKNTNLFFFIKKKHLPSTKARSHEVWMSCIQKRSIPAGAFARGASWRRLCAPCSGHPKSISRKIVRKFKTTSGTIYSERKERGALAWI